jgi:nucleoid DNA-binding protein
MMPLSGQWRGDADHEKLQPSFQFGQHEDEADIDPLGIIKERLIAGEDVLVSGFGKWCVNSKHARRGRNPQTGESIVLDARKVVAWQYSPKLKRSVNSLSTKGRPADE